MVRLPPGSLLIPPRGQSLRGVWYTKTIGGRTYICKWPRAQPTARNEREAHARSMLAVAASCTAYMSAQEQAFSRELSKRTTLLPRDMLMMSLFGRVGYVVTLDGRKVYSMASMQDVSNLLDTIAQTRGDVMFRGPTWWQRLPIGTLGQVLTVSPEGLPQWAPGGGGGGDGWTDIPLGTGTIGAFWGTDTLRPSGHWIPCQDGDLISVRLTARRAAGQAIALNLTTDDTSCIQAVIQPDNNFVYYRYATNNNTGTVLVGGLVPQNYTGLHTLQIDLQVGQSTDHTMSRATANLNLSVSGQKSIPLAPAHFLGPAHGSFKCVIGFNAASAPDLRGLQYRRETP